MQRQATCILTNLVTKDLTVNLNGLTTPNQVKESALLTMSKDMIDVQLATLDKAKVPDLSGRCQILRYSVRSFWWGMVALTPPPVKASDKAPWSDNGTA